MELLIVLSLIATSVDLVFTILIYTDKSLPSVLDRPIKGIRQAITPTAKPKAYISKNATVAQVKDRARFDAMPAIDQELELSYREKYEHN